MFVALAASHAGDHQLPHRQARQRQLRTDFIHDLRERVIGLPEISARTAFTPYNNAIRDAFGKRVAHGVINKTYSVTHLT